VKLAQALDPFLRELMEQPDYSGEDGESGG
jgi:hypothetical protein